MPDAATDTSTIRVDDPDSALGRSRARHRRAMGWVTSALLALVIGSALLDGVGVVDLWGVDDGRVTVTGADGTTLSVRYPSVVRPGLAAPMEITVERPGGFDGDVELSIDNDFLQLWDVNGVFPSPADERSAGDAVVWTFDPPDGEVLTVFYEARIEPGMQLIRREATVSLLDPNEVLRADFTTKVRP